MRSLTRDEVREVDRRAIEEFGLPGIVLMENAGRNVAALLHSLDPSAAIAIACGKGNNAGDGFVMARHLENLGHDVRVLLAGDPADFRGDAATQWRVVERAGIPARRLADGDEADWERALESAGWVVDALLGTGATGVPHGAVAKAIGAINAVSRPQAVRVLAVDLPSGMDCDTGLPPGACVRADVTATFVARKVGFDAPDAAAWIGAVHVIDIGVPRSLLVALERSSR
jgi:NAD(P)H-hydrate epimerase